MSSSSPTNLMSLAFLKRILLLIFFFVLTGVKDARADIAPAEPPSGSNPLPGNELTNVRMMAETVLIEIDSEDPINPGLAAVTATFTMRNLGTEDEQMQVRFPLDQTIGWGKLCESPFPQFYPIDDLRVKVDGQPVSTQETYQTINFESPLDGTPAVFTIPCWSNFHVTFPAGKDVSVEVKYSSEPYHDAEGAYVYDYILETGTGWKGTIGSADIIFQLPYPLDESNFYSCMPAGCKVEEMSVKWHLEDFEPSSNPGISLLPPPLWQSITDEKENITRNPRDGEAWGRLGKAHKEAILAKRGFRADAAGEEMYRLSKEAYTQAVTLLPNDADWHYGFAELLCINAEWNSYLVESSTQGWQECMSQIKQTLDLNPDHKSANELLQDLAYFNSLVDLSGSQPDYLILTPQPTVTITATALQSTIASSPASTEKPQQLQATKEPTELPTKIPAATATAGAGSKTSNLLQDLALIGLLILLVFGIVRFRKG
jgi:hypothetical protein